MGKQSIPRFPIPKPNRLRATFGQPTKAELVAAMIRGMDVNKAVATLTFSRRRIAGDVKSLYSAIANAENNHSLDVDRFMSKKPCW